VTVGAEVMPYDCRRNKGCAGVCGAGGVGRMVEMCGACQGDATCVSGHAEASVSSDSKQR
jgi:hypothetical protein